MMRIRRAVYAQLPAWAQPENPVLRYLLDRPQRRPLWRGLVWAAWLAILAGLVGINAAAYDADWSPWADLAAGSSPGTVAYSVLYYPLVILQGGALALALLAASNAVTTEQQRGTWEAFKVTSHGAEMVIRARWAAVFFQLRWVLILLVLPRLFFAARMLAGVADYQGYHIDLYITGITPEVPLEGAVILLAALMTAALVQIPVLVGLYAALGVLLSARVHRRGVMLLLRVMGVLAHLVVVGLALEAGSHVLSQTLLPRSAHVTHWLELLGMGVWGDQGLRLMDLETALQTWTDVHYAVWLGAALLAAIVAEVFVTNALLGLAVRWASRPARN